MDQKVDLHVQKVERKGNVMGAGAPKGNKNAEKWDYDNTKEFFMKALELSKDPEYDFIGEIARDLGSYKDIFKHLVDRFPEFQCTHKQIISNCESNCYSNTKKGKIVAAVGIVNLKSNHGWTDRVDNTTKGEQIEAPAISFKRFKSDAE